MSNKPLRLMIYDATCSGLPGLPGLSHSWWLGGHLYKMLGRLDAFIGVESWTEGLSWLAMHEPERPIAEVQFWGHGRWGSAFVDRDPLDITAFQSGHPWFPWLEELQGRMSGPEALWWFRTCETFGAVKGQDFAKAFASFMGCRAAGHTYIIGPWQSGLHCLGPGQEPTWDPSEGIREGNPHHPTRALWSGPFKPHTIHMLNGTIPPAWDRSHDS